MKKFKFKIYANKIPIVNNPILEYVENKKLTRLLGEIYYEDKLIAKGVILDFYKKFKNVNNKTKIEGFYYYGKFRDEKTGFGQRIFKLKYYNNPSLNKKEKEKYLKKISYIFKQFINSFLWEQDINVITFVPSSKKIPDEVSKNISSNMNINLKDVIEKNRGNQSKNLSLNEQNFNKYKIKYGYLNERDTILVIDDVVGTGATFCEIMYKLNRFNNKINYFLAVVKDVKR